ncbi:hypothetical protein CHUAL_005340 [Chamberlinius hualienensis]
MIISNTPMSNEGDFCAQCAMIGVESKIKKLYIDFSETILLCENETCLFPYLSPSSSVCNEQNSAVNAIEPPQVQEPAEPIDFSFIDSILNGPVYDSNVSELVSQLGAETTDCSQTTDCVSSYEKEIQQELPVTFVTSEIDSNTSAFQTVKPDVTINAQPDVTSRVTCASKKIQFPCFTPNLMAPSIRKSKRLTMKSNSSTPILKRPPRLSPLKPKRSPAPKVSKQLDIFSFSEAANKPRSKRQPPKRSQLTPNLTDSLFSDTTKNSLVRHWLAKESPRKAYPGFGVQCSKSVEGTSDGRSVTDSVPPSPESTC